MCVCYFLKSIAIDSSWIPLPTIPLPWNRLKCHQNHCEGLLFKLPNNTVTFMEWSAFVGHIDSFSMNDSISFALCLVYFLKFGGQIQQHYQDECQGRGVGCLIRRAQIKPPTCEAFYPFVLRELLKGACQIKHGECTFFICQQSPRYNDSQIRLLAPWELPYGFYT